MKPYHSILKSRLVMILVINILISCNLESYINLGNGYHLQGQDAYSSICRTINNEGSCELIIAGAIVDYSLNDKFILIHREATEEAKTYFGNYDIWKKQEGDSIHQYWIIEKDNNNVHGPLTWDNYLTMRKKLGVPEILSLKK